MCASEIQCKESNNMVVNFDAQVATSKTPRQVRKFAFPWKIGRPTKRANGPRAPQYRATHARIVPSELLMRCSNYGGPAQPGPGDPGCAVGEVHNKESAGQPLA